MRILLVAATKFEIRPSLNLISLLSEENDRFIHFRCRKTFVDVVIPGIGMVQTAFHMGKILAQANYDFALNAGVAGSYRGSIKLGEVVQVTEECITEMGAEDGENFLSMFELGLMDPENHPYKGGRLINNSMIRSNALAKLPAVKGATSNTVHGNTESIRKITTKFLPDIESMEGAAFLYSCLSERIPCAEIRAVSNYVEERDKSRWNLELALKNLNSVLPEIIKEICI